MQLAISVYVNYRIHWGKINGEASTSACERGGEQEEREKKEGEKESRGERQDDIEQREGGIECSGLAGNSDAVFMDVYLC